MKKLLLIFVLFISYNQYAQTGKTPSVPFVNLGQARTVTKDSIYHFNIGGKIFSTFVKVGGWIEIANDSGAGIGVLPKSTALDSSKRGILPAATLSVFTGLSDIRIASSNGSTDVTTTKSNILNKISTNTTLYAGTSTDTGNSTAWTGTGASHFNLTGALYSSPGLHLDSNIFHASGNINTFSWVPINGYQKDYWGNAATGPHIPNSGYIRLFARAPYASILPIELNYFKATPLEQDVLITWQTASEKNNDYFTIERSQNGVDYTAIAELKGAGNSTTTLNYSFKDETPLNGTSYYRLKQTDFDLRSKTYDAKAVKLNLSSIALKFYPNPTRDYVYIENIDVENFNISVLNISGVNYTDKLNIEKINDNKLKIDLTLLNSNIYHLVINDMTYKIVKY